MIELLMVIILVGILSAVAVPQFLNFRNEGKKGVVTAKIQTMRVEIANASVKARMKCNVPSFFKISIWQLRSNNLCEGNIADSTDLCYHIPGNQYSCNNYTQRQCYVPSQLSTAADCAIHAGRYGPWGQGLEKDLENPFKPYRIDLPTHGYICDTVYCDCDVNNRCSGTVMTDPDVGYCYDNLTQTIWPASNVAGECNI